MDHQLIEREEASRYVKGQLSVDRFAEIEHHTSICPTCYGVVAAMSVLAKQNRPAHKPNLGNQ